MALQYYRAIVISNTGGQLTDHTILVSLNYNDFAGKVDASMYGLRFTDASGNAIPHWIEPASRGTTATLCYVKIPVIAASPATTTIYIFYGDTGLSSIESGEDTFYFFDEFDGEEGENVDSIIWDSRTGTWTYEIDGDKTIAECTTGAVSYVQLQASNYTLPRSPGIIMLWRYKSTYRNDRHVGMNLYDSGGDYLYGYHVGESSIRKAGIGVGQPWGWNGTNFSFVDGTYYTHLLVMYPEGTNARHYYDLIGNPASYVNRSLTTIANADQCASKISSYQSGTTSHVIGVDYVAMSAYTTAVSVGAYGAEVTTAPIISSISPLSGYRSEEITSLIITGENFEDGATVNLEKDGQADISATNVVVDNENRITCDIEIPSLAVYGWWKLRVTNP